MCVGGRKTTGFQKLVHFPVPLHPTPLAQPLDNTKLQRLNKEIVHTGWFWKYHWNASLQQDIYLIWHWARWGLVVCCPWVMWWSFPARIFWLRMLWWLIYFSHLLVFSLISFTSVISESQWDKKEHQFYLVPSEWRTNGNPNFLSRPKISTQWSWARSGLQPLFIGLWAIRGYDICKWLEIF